MWKRWLPERVEYNVTQIRVTLLFVTYMIIMPLVLVDFNV